MADVFSKEKRSEVMSRIRGSGNKDTELAMISIFRKNRITGWRRHQPLYGKPDFVFSKKKVVVFVDGCFWHGCPYHSTMPKNNGEFWEHKLRTNKARDLKVSQELKNEGWVVIRVWEHELKDQDKVVDRLKNVLAKGKSSNGLKNR